MDVSLFDFELPEERIALRPAFPRDAARLLVVRDSGFEHAFVRDLPHLLHSGDILVANDTKVIPARLQGYRSPRPNTAGEGPRVEAMLHKRVGSDRFLAFARPARKLALGDRIQFEGFSAEIIGRGEGGEVELGFSLEGSALDAAVAASGQIPLPPYISGKRKTDAQDRFDYQTTFATYDGSVAAPTAGLHFTPALLAALDVAGISRETLTLHVGAGTFLPVTAADTFGHRMHAEWAILSSSAASRINAARSKGGRMVAVGTTSLRTLETAAAEDGTLSPLERDTDIFITPGYRFKTAEILLTNFHLPRSTLFMLVCAFAGTKMMRAAYQEAIREQYRFYSYGDACLLFRNETRA